MHSVNIHAKKIIIRVPNTLITHSDTADSRVTNRTYRMVHKKRKLGG